MHSGVCINGDPLMINQVSDKYREAASRWTGFSIWDFLPFNQAVLFK